MNSRERFLETMAYGRPDRVPYFEEGIRPEVLQAWRSQGLAADADPQDLFTTDRREEMDLDVDPHPWPDVWPSSSRELGHFARLLDPEDPSRLPSNLQANQLARKDRQHVLMLRVHRGFFLSMGVQDWGRFCELMKLIHNDPGFVRDSMRLQGEFCAAMADRLLQEVQVDAAVFSEPIGDNHGPLISPTMFADLVLASYRPLLDVLREGKRAIRREILAKVPPLVEQGGYVPLADGRVREDIPFENYRYYRRLLEKVTG